MPSLDIHWIYNWRRALLYGSWYASVATAPLVAGGLLGPFFTITEGRVTPETWGKVWDGYWGWFLLNVALLGVICVLHSTRKHWKSRRGVQTDLLLANFQQSARYIADAQHMSVRERDGELSAVAVHLVQALVNSYPQIDDVRATIYKFNAKKTELKVLKTAGTRLPSGPFRSSDPGRGLSAINFALTNESPEIIDDTKKALEGWKGSGKGYRCYISAPIVSSGDRYGMLTVDAKSPYSLTQADQVVVWAAASLLGIMMASIKGRVSQPRDTVEQVERSEDHEDGEPAEAGQEATVGA